MQKDRAVLFFESSEHFGAFLLLLGALESAAEEAPRLGDCWGLQDLIALIEEDLSKLECRNQRYRGTKRKPGRFVPVQQRHARRVEKSNALLGKALELPELMDERQADAVN